MQKIKYALVGVFAVLVMLWLFTEPSVLRSATFLAWRDVLVQLSGTLAIGCMSVAMILALRPRWLEPWLGGLDKMYRLHKWLGISALVVVVVHWLWAKGPKWAIGWGLLERPMRGPRPVFENPVEALFKAIGHTAEEIGEWGFYAIVVLIVLALVTRFPYRTFFKTHNFMAVAYLVMAFHAVVLIKFSYWVTPYGLVMAMLIAGGTWAAVVALLGRVGIQRLVKGSIASLQYYSGVRSLEVEIAGMRGWPGHKAGQFAFVTMGRSEGGHPYTIASGWHSAETGLKFLVKELGDYTTGLREKLSLGQEVTVEGPYGCFTFDDNCPHQIWIGGGVGMTPFMARMQEMARESGGSHSTNARTVDFFYSTAEVDEEVLEKLRTDASAAGVRLHVLVDSRDGHLTGPRVREAVPQWQAASIWFCGPARFGEALKRDFGACGFPVKARFHQELFAMR